MEDAYWGSWFYLSEFMVIYILGHIVLHIRAHGAGFRVQGAGCRVQGAGRRVQGAGCRVKGVRWRHTEYQAT